jgi:hypothetical protein
MDVFGWLKFVLWKHLLILIPRRMGLSKRKKMAKEKTKRNI